VIDSCPQKLAKNCPDTLARCFKVLGLNATDEEIKHSFDTIDSDGKDEISREEFVAAVKDFFLGVEETELSNVLYGKLLPC
jgi:Ca2+-binding EF-hand superfamily protein